MDLSALIVVVLIVAALIGGGWLLARTFRGALLIGGGILAVILALNLFGARDWAADNLKNINLQVGRDSGTTSTSEADRCRQRGGSFDNGICVVTRDTGTAATPSTGGATGSTTGGNGTTGTQSGTPSAGVPVSPTTCPTAADAANAVGQTVTPVGTEGCAFTRRDHPNSKTVRCPNGWACTVQLKDDRVLVMTGRGETYDSVASTYRPLLGAAAVCTVVRGESEFAKRVIPVYAVFYAPKSGDPACDAAPSVSGTSQGAAAPAAAPTQTSTSGQAAIPAATAAPVVSGLTVANVEKFCPPCAGRLEQLGDDVHLKPPADGRTCLNIQNIPADVAWDNWNGTAKSSGQGGNIPRACEAGFRRAAAA